jgi:EmrB/QacA subfamily drug resistance transporter
LDRRFITPLIVACALFMESVDSTVIATSLEAIARDLRQDPLALKLAITSYLVSQAVFIPASSWIADRFGARTVFRLAIGVFVIGSIMCGLSDSLSGFVVARVLQGLGGAMMMPVGRLIVLRSIPRSEMIKAFAYLAIPAMIGPVIGPPLGGFITTYLHWRWIFWINVPVGIVGIVMVTLYIPDVREENPGRLDIVGFLLAGLALSCLIFGFTVTGGHFLALWQIMGLLVAGFGALGLYLLHSRRTENPLLDLTLLRIRNFRYAVLSSMLFRISVGAVPFLLPLLLQVGFGMSAAQSGMITFASAGGSMFIKAAAPAILRRYGFKIVLMFCGAGSGILLAVNGLYTAQTPLWVIFGVLFLTGFFRSLQFTSLNGLAFADVPTPQMSKATSLVSVLQQFATAAGVAIGAGVVELALFARGGDQLTAADFSWSFFTVAALTVASSLVFIPMPRDAGAEVSAGEAKRDPAR